MFITTVCVIFSHTNFWVRFCSIIELIEPNRLINFDWFRIPNGSISNLCREEGGRKVVGMMAREQ